MRIERCVFGRWIIVHPTDSGLAWSGSRWVPHARGIPTGEVQVSNYETRAEAEQAASAVRMRGKP